MCKEIDVGMLHLLNCRKLGCVLKEDMEHIMEQLNSTMSYMDFLQTADKMDMEDLLP